MQSPSFYSGTSNIALPLKQSEYPPEFIGASRLTYYASLFSSLEVNSTFYKLPRPATVEKWRDSVPPHFRFTFKIPKTVTHAKGLQFNAEELESSPFPTGGSLHSFTIHRSCRSRYC